MIVLIVHRKLGTKAAMAIRLGGYSHNDRVVFIELAIHFRPSILESRVSQYCCLSQFSDLFSDKTDPQLIA